MSDQYGYRDQAKNENGSKISMDGDGQFKDNESYSQASQGYPSYPNNQKNSQNGLKAKH